MIPEALVKQMNRADDFGKGLQVRRQMVYAAMSLGYYDSDPSKLNTTEYMESMVKRYQPFAFVDGTHFQCAFGHLEGYSAVYYTYMWSLVIAKDMFAQFDANEPVGPGRGTEVPKGGPGAGRLEARRRPRFRLHRPAVQRGGLEEVARQGRVGAVRELPTRTCGVLRESPARSILP